MKELIKDIEWRGVTSDTRATGHVAGILVASVAISRGHGFIWKLYVIGSSVSGAEDTLEAATQAAEACYKKRILTALRQDRFTPTYSEHEPDRRRRGFYRVKNSNFEMLAELKETARELCWSTTEGTEIAHGDWAEGTQFSRIHF